MQTATILELDLNKATYRPGEPVEITVTVGGAETVPTPDPSPKSGGGEVPFAGAIELEIFYFDQPIDRQQLDITIKSGNAAELRFTVAPPLTAPCGYGIEVRLLDGNGAVVATKSGAFDVLARWSQAPRYGFLSSFGPEIDAATIAEAERFLRRFHIDVVQFYDWMWRHYRLLPPQEEFTDALARPTSLRAVREAIAAVQRIGAAAFAYGAVYGAEPEYADANREQVLFDAEGKPISLAELFFIVDIAPDSPWTAMITEEFARAIRALGFDGIHLDQYGFPKGDVVNGAGVTRNLEDDFPPLIDRARTLVREAKPAGGVIFNAVGNWPIARVARTSQDAIYIEVWPPDIDDNDLRRLIREAKALGRRQQVILAAYLTPFLEQPEAPESEAAALLATATIASAGGFHLLLGERNGILCDPYYPKFGTLRGGFVPRLRAYYDHLVRYQEWLTTQDVIDWHAPVVGDVTANATPGEVWAITRRTETARIVHLIDLRDQSATEWNASRAPWQPGKPPVRLFIPIDAPIGDALLIAPDFPDGRSRPLAFQTDGEVVTVEVELPGPWASVVLRLGE